MKQIFPENIRRSLRCAALSLGLFATLLESSWADGLESGPHFPTENGTAQQKIAALYGNVQAEIMAQAESETMRQALAELSLGCQSLPVGMAESTNPLCHAALLETRHYQQEVLAQTNLWPPFSSPTMMKTAYGQALTRFQSLLRAVRESYGCENIFIVNSAGFVIYADQQTWHFAQNLCRESEKNTGLVQAFLEVWQPSPSFVDDHVQPIGVQWVDFAPDSSSPHSYFAYVSAPIYGVDGQKAGVLIYQFSGL